MTKTTHEWSLQTIQWAKLFLFLSTQVWWDSCFVNKMKKNYSTDKKWVWIIKGSYNVITVQLLALVGVLQIMKKKKSQICYIRHPKNSNFTATGEGPLGL